MKRQTLWAMSAILLFSVGGAACSENDDHGHIDEIFECRYDETPLNWADPAPDSWGFESYGALVEHFAGTYEVQAHDNEGTLQVARGEGTPLERIEIQGGCEDELIVPFALTLTQGDMKWSHNVPYRVNHNSLAHHAEHFSDPSEYNALTAFAPLPELNENQTLESASLRLELKTSESIKLAFNVAVETISGTGPDASVSLDVKPWFKLEAALENAGE